MNEFEIVKHIMMLDHVSYDDFSDRLGYKSKATSYNRLNGKHIYVDTLKKFLDELGYDIVIRKKENSNSEYIINDNDTPSPLRFHDMSLNLESIFGDAPAQPKKTPGLTIGERNLRSEELKQRIHELTFFECDRELRKIWGMRDPTPEGRQPLNQYTAEYEKYSKEFSRLYNTALPVNALIPIVNANSEVTSKKKPTTARKKKPKIELPPVPLIISEGAHGKIITKDEDFEVRDMSEDVVFDRAKEQKLKQSHMLAGLVAGFQMED